MAKPDSEQLLDEALERLASGEETLASCAVRYAQVWEEIGPLLELALALEDVSAENAFELEAAFLPDLEKGWERLSAEIRRSSLTVASADSGSPPATPPAKIIPFRQPTPARRSVPQRWLARPLARVALLALAFILFFVSFTGAAYASEPSDPLYNAKLWLDRSGQLFAFSEVDKAHAQLTYAQHRLDEIEALNRTGRSAKATPAANAYEQAIVQTVSYLDDFEVKQTALEAKVQQQTAQLQRLLQATTLPPATIDKLASAAEQLQKGEKQLEELPQSKAPETTVTPKPSVTPEPTATPVATPSPTSSLSPATPVPAAPAGVTVIPVATSTPPPFYLPVVSTPIPVLPTAAPATATATSIPAVATPTFTVPAQGTQPVATTVPTSTPRPIPTIVPTATAAPKPTNIVVVEPGATAGSSPTSGTTPASGSSPTAGATTPPAHSTEPVANPTPVPVTTVTSSEPTATPQPTTTPPPAATSQPSATPNPTNTPLPTATPKPTVAPQPPTPTSTPCNNGNGNGNGNGRCKP